MEIRHDRAAHRFVADTPGGEAFLSYVSVGDDRLDFEHTFVPESARNRGVGADIVLHALEYARGRNAQVIPTCSFVRRVLDEHDEYASLIAR